jgi:hypothetical protein
MERQPLTQRVFVGYMVAVFGLLAVIVGLLYGLFRTRIPEFTDAFVESPATAVSEDPLAMSAILGVLLALVLLFALIVLFGARYGPVDEERNYRPAEE